MCPYHCWMRPRWYLAPQGLSNIESSGQHWISSLVAQEPSREVTKIHGVLAKSHNNTKTTIPMLEIRWWIPTHHVAPTSHKELCTPAHACLRSQQSTGCGQAGGSAAAYLPCLCVIPALPKYMNNGDPYGQGKHICSYSGHYTPREPL